MKRTRRVARGKKTKGSKRRCRCMSSKGRGGTRSRPNARGSPKSSSTKGPVLGLPRRTTREKNQRHTKPTKHTRHSRPTRPTRPSELRPLSKHSPPSPKVPSPSAVPLTSLSKTPSSSRSSSPQPWADKNNLKKSKIKQEARRKAFILLDKTLKVLPLQEQAGIKDILLREQKSKHLKRLLGIGSS